MTSVIRNLHRPCRASPGGPYRMQHSPLTMKTTTSYTTQSAETACPAHDTITTIRVTLEALWEPKATMGYTYRASWILPDGTVGGLKSRSPEHRVCRAIIKAGYGQAGVLFIDHATGKDRSSFPRADKAAPYEVEERTSGALKIVRGRP